MTVKELIKKLSILPQDILVVVNGPDGDGYDTISNLEKIILIKKSMMNY